MPLPLKFPKRNTVISKHIAVLTLAVTIGLTAPCFAQTKSQKTYKKPIGGPELLGPIVKPGDPANETTFSANKDRPQDLAYGAFQRGYYLTALKLALPRAESGDPAAQTLIAELYWNGLGIARNRAKAVEWYKFASDAGNREAQFAYANMLLRGKEVPLDKKLGEEIMRQAAEAGHHRAQFNLAQIMTAKRPTWAGFKAALPFYEAAATAGIVDAQYAMANIHAEAKGVPYNDDVKAYEWLKKAALGGLDAAQVEYGVWLANGRGSKKDLSAARFWFTKAASRGNIIAQNRLANIYAFGAGVEVDAIKAGAWHILARRGGMTDTGMDRFFQRLSEIDKKRAIEAANQLSRLRRS